MLFIPLSINAQKNYSALLDSFMQSAVTINQFNGSVLVAKSGNLIYKKNFGFKDFNTNRILDDNSMFELGVVTEQFTAVGILLLCQQGKLELNDPITKYFPQLPYKQITIKHLLTHTSGLPDYYQLMTGKWKEGEYADNNDLIAFLSQARNSLLFEPGTKYQEQDFTAFPLLASVIEKISGQAYADYMRSNIFIPLKMQHTEVLIGLHSKRVGYPDMTTGIPYDEFKNEYISPDTFVARYLTRDLYYIVDNIVGGVSISSTTGDLLLWDNALKNDLLLTSEMKKAMFYPHTIKDTSQKIFNGFGIWIGTNELGNYFISQDGGNATLGYSTAIVRYPDEDILIIVLCNRHKNTSQVSGTLAYIMFDREVEPLYIHKAIAVHDTLLDKYVGKYAAPNIFELIKKDTSIYMRFGNEPDLKLLPESTSKLFSSSGEYDFQFEFETDTSGKIVKAFFISRGIKKQMTKLN